MCRTAAPLPVVRRQEYPSSVLSGLSKSRPLTLRNAEYVQVCVQVSGHSAAREVLREPPSQACVATRIRATGRRVVGDDRAAHRSNAANAHLRRPRRRHVLAGRPTWAPYRLRPKHRSESSRQSAHRISRRLANRNGVRPRRRRRNERVRIVGQSDPWRQLCQGASKAMGTDLLTVRIDLDPL